MAKKTKKTTKRNTHSNSQTASARNLDSTVQRTAAQDKVNKGASGTRGSATDESRDSQRARQFDTNSAASRETWDQTDNATTSERGPNRNQRSPARITPPKRDAPFFLK